MVEPVEDLLLLLFTPYLNNLAKSSDWSCLSITLNSLANLSQWRIMNTCSHVDTNTSSVDGFRYTFTLFLSSRNRH